MSPWWLLLGAAVGLSTLAVVVLCRSAKRGSQPAPAEPDPPERPMLPVPYIPPPITDQYVTNEFAVIWWNYSVTAPDPQEHQ